MRLLIVADTHLPKRARELPAEVWAAVEEADVVLHAGDWVDVTLLDELEARAGRVVGVYGNTATSRGTPRPRPGCGCSTPGLLHRIEPGPR